MRKIELTQNKFALVDDEDYEWLNQWKWYAARHRNTFYAQRAGGKRGTKLIKMHRVITNAADGVQIDHKDFNGLNNTRLNLRKCNDSQNQSNKPIGKLNKSGYKGVCWHKRVKKYVAQITHNKKVNYLGYFDNPIDAAKAYDIASIKFHGEFAWTNFQETI